MKTPTISQRICAAAALFLALLLAAATTSAQVALRGASSATGTGGIVLVPNTNPNTAIRGAVGSAQTIEIKFSTTSTTLAAGPSIQITTPALTVINDVMIAAITVTGSGANITTLAGWTNVINPQQTEAPGTRMRILWKKATAADIGATHTFALTGGPTAVVGGITAYSGVDGVSAVVTAAPAPASALFAAGTNPAAPSLTGLTIANTMLLTFYAYASSSTWTTPAGMTSAIDIGSPTIRPNTGGVSMKTAYQPWPTTADTGTRTSAPDQGATMQEGSIGVSLLLRPAVPIVLQTPSGAQNGDVMFASISIRGDSDSAAVQAPKWTLVRSMPGTGVANDTQLYVFRKTVSAAETATQVFSAFGASQGVGAIVAYRGVHTTAINAELGQTTPSSLSHATPQITTTLANTKLLASYAVSSARPWVTGPAGFTIQANVADPVGLADNGESLALYDMSQAAATTVGPYTATISATGSDPDVGATHLLAVRPAACSIQIPVPAPAPQAGDMMIATIAVRSSAANILTIPTGWSNTGTARQNSAAGDTLALLTYYKTAGASEAALGSYQFTFDSCTHVAGGIQAFSGVDTSVTPVFSSRQSNEGAPAGTTHTTPSVTPPSAGSMLVPILVYSSSTDTWTKAAGSAAMSEIFHARQPITNNTVGVDIVGYNELWAPSTATGTRAASVDNDPGIGVTAMIALKPLVVIVAPARFNAYDAPVVSVTGVIQTKVVGSSASLAIVAVKTDGSGPETTFNDTVKVEIVDSSTGGSLDASNCNASWPVITTSPTSWSVLLGSGTGTQSVTIPNAYRNLRVRIIYPATATYATATAKGCSVDNFAVRPASIAVAASDNNWTTAGTSRPLATVTTTGGNAHRAGQPFTITVTPSPAATNYDGDPTTVSALACIPAASGGSCTSGVLGASPLVVPIPNPLTFSAGGSGTRVSTAAYSEAGAFNLTLVDTDFTAVDAGDTPADCTATGRYVCPAAATAIGRFVPDRFAVTAVTAPTFRTFNETDANCSVPPAGPRRSFTYIGQFFGYQTAPTALITAQNTAGGTTTNYRGTTYWNNVVPSQTIANNPVRNLDLAQIGTPAVAGTGSTGTGTLTPLATGTLAFLRDNATPQGEFTANLSLTLSVSDASNGEGTIATTTPLVFNGPGLVGIAFDGGGAATGTFRYGRLQLGSANGSPLAPLLVPMETQFWNGSAFATNTADHCTRIDATNIGRANYAGKLSAGDTTPTVTGTAFLSGRNTISMSAPGAGRNGSVDLVVGLTTPIDTCNPLAPAPTLTGATKAYLRGRWCSSAPTQTKDTTGRATFGIYLGSDEVIYSRENF